MIVTADLNSAPYNSGVFLSDQDSDKRLTLSEFISLPVGTVENQQAAEIEDEWVRERKKEFEEVIDSNRDGIVTMDELEVSDEKATITMIDTEMICNIIIRLVLFICFK